MTDPESYITEHTLVYEEKRPVKPKPHLVFFFFSQHAGKRSDRGGAANLFAAERESERETASYAPLETQRLRSWRMDTSCEFASLMGIKVSGNPETLSYLEAGKAGSLA